MCLFRMHFGDFWSFLCLGWSVPKPQHTLCYSLLLCRIYIACSSPSHPFKFFCPLVYIVIVIHVAIAILNCHPSVYFATCQIFSLKIGLQVFLDLNIQQRHLWGHQVSCIRRSSMRLSMFSPWVANPRPTEHICKLDMYILQNCAII